jgi:tRNA pseudouridine55 synthase
LYERNVNEYFISIDDYFKENPSIKLENKKLELFLNGAQLTYKLNDGVYRIYFQEKFIGLGIIKNNLLKRDIII